MTTSDPVHLQKAVDVAKTRLSDVSGTITEEELKKAAKGALAMAEALDESVTREDLLSILRAEVSVWMGEQTILNSDDDDHDYWLAKRRQDQRDWPFWNNYKAFIAKRMSPKVVQKLDGISDDVLDRLGDPKNTNPWDRRGLVVGNVQSGKTANYLGLIAKAADAGYKFIVVLAGSHNSLRSQTQYRIDEGILGFDSGRDGDGHKKRIGVGAMNVKTPTAISLTSSEEKGDFNKNAAGQFTGRVDPDGPPFILVVKKNKSVLENLYEWVTATTGDDVGAAERKISTVSLLLIDDEADHSSVNTKKVDAFEDPDDETDPTAINQAIRRLLKAFDRSSYVGFTATPYANIFIPDADERSKHGDDLFPRSFVIRIKPPSNYIGPAEVFGLPYSISGDTGPREGLPIVQTVVDQDGWLPKRHNKTAVPGPLPQSLRDALKSFVIACAVRDWRGEGDTHNSMLVHVTRFNDVQNRITDQIKDEIETLRNGLRYSDKELVGEFRRVWDDIFLEPALSPAMREATSQFKNQVLPKWQDLSNSLARCADRVLISEINGSTKDALQYKKHPQGLWVVAVGGDKLSRGLTLEGLSISYYLRPSGAYDTLMQMGRWFGYRGDYLDVSRLFTTKDLQNDYKMIALANEELNEKFDEMAAIDASPKTFALYVRESDSRLAITSATKMRESTKLNLTFSDDFVETLVFKRSAEHHVQNLATVGRFFSDQSAAGRQADDVGSLRTWKHVPGADVAKFFSQFVIAEESRVARSSLLAEWVTSRNKIGELVDWSVHLVSSSDKAAKRISIPDLGNIGLSRRADDRPDDPVRYTVKRLGTQQHEAVDLTEEEIRESKAMRDRESKRLMIEADAVGDKKKRRTAERLGLGPYTRKVRNPKSGLLVIYLLDPTPARIEGADAIPGFMIAFPPSKDDDDNVIRIPSRYLSKGIVDEI